MPELDLSSIEETDKARPIADLGHQQPGEKGSDPIEEDFFFFMQFSCLKELFSSFIACPNAQCSGDIDIMADMKKRRGLSLLLMVKCKLCGFACDTFTSRKAAEKHVAGPKPFEVNLRAVLAIKEIGKGYEALSTFCTIMNMVSPMSSTSFDACIDKIHGAFSDEVKSSLENASKETTLKCPPNKDGEFPQCTVSVDGTWQTRGFSSLNGIVTCTAQESRKCIDYEVLTKYCTACKRWEGRDKSSSQYEEWKAGHECPINHRGSSSAMETAGALRIFKRSENMNNLQYTYYLGDGDSSAFGTVRQAFPYGQDIEIKKLECVGHIQKRVGTHLRKLLQDHKREILADGKKLSGKGRLTSAVINKLQNYFGLAIRQNTDKMYPMKKAVFASLFHNADLVDEKRHQFCPQGKQSWCRWRRQQDHNGHPTFKPKLSIPLAVYDKVLPVFRELAKDELMEKCIHGKTQNANESLNSLIWQRCPKTYFAGRKSVEIAAASAVIHFNDGPLAVHNVLSRLGVIKGYYTIVGSDKKCKKRKRKLEVKNTEKSKRRRKTLRAMKKGWQDKEMEEEGDTYGSGNF